VDTGPPPKKRWELTPEAFNKLLSFLDPDRERAGMVYEKLRLKLMKFFEWRGSAFPEDHADEVLNRVTKKVDEGEVVRDFYSYSHRIASLFFLETTKDPAGRSVPVEDMPSIPAAPNSTDDEELRLECFENCLRALPAESCELITQYYQGERRARIDHRKALAERLEIPLNALRIRTHRIRMKLEACVEDCLRKSQLEVKQT